MDLFGQSRDPDGVILSEEWIYLDKLLIQRGSYSGMDLFGQALDPDGVILRNGFIWTSS
jgi:hypothetical protein